MLSPTPLHTGAGPDQSIPQGSRISSSDWRTESPRLTPSPFHSHQATVQAIGAPAPPSQDVTPEYQNMIKGMVADAVRDLLSGNGASSVTLELGNKWSLPESTRSSQFPLVADLIDHQLANRLILRGGFASSDSHNASPSPSLHLPPPYSSNSKHHYDFSELPASPTSSYSTTGGYNAGIIGMGPSSTRPRISGQSDHHYTPRSMLSVLPYSMTNAIERPGNPSAHKHMPTSHPNEPRAQEKPRTLPSNRTFIHQDEEVSQRMRALRVAFDAPPSSTLATSMVSPSTSGASTSYHLGPPTRADPPGYQELPNLFLSSADPIMPPTQCFRPMSAVLEAKFNPQALPFSQDGTGSLGTHSRFSTRYLGKHTEKNASHDHLANHENCSLWLRNLPPNITYAELLDTISGIGRVWATYINRPDAKHDTAAAKVIFFNPEAAAKYLKHIESTNLQIQGLAVTGEYNRVKIPRQLSGGPQASRVLVITGHSDFVNKDSLTRFFGDLIQFHTDRVIERFRVGTRAVIEFRFGSYRSQAQSAKTALERNQPSGLVCVRYGLDPCEVGETPFSYEPGSE